MKKLNFVIRTILAVAIVLFATSCSKKKTIEPDVGVGKVHKGMNEQQVEAELGRPNSKAGGIWKYQSKGLWVLFGNDGVMFNIHCIKPFAGVTKEGIGIGSTRDTVIKAFGTPNQIQQINSDSENLWFASLKISCTLEHDKITEMVIHLN
jgi:hypothetical protein